MVNNCLFLYIYLVKLIYIYVYIYIYMYVNIDQCRCFTSPRRWQQLLTSSRANSSRAGSESTRFYSNLIIIISFNNFACWFSFCVIFFFVFSLILFFDLFFGFFLLFFWQCFFLVSLHKVKIYIYVIIINNCIYI